MDELTKILEWIQTLTGQVGKHDAYIKTSLENQKEIFDRLKEIRTILDERTLINKNIDNQLTTLTCVAQTNTSHIKTLQATVENGLSDRTKSIETSVDCLRKCVQDMVHKKEIEDIQEKSGMSGFFSESWTEFKKKFGWVFFIILLWLLTWGFFKAIVFQEYPFPSKMSSTGVKANVK